MSGVLNVIAAAGGMNVIASPSDLTGTGFPTASAGPVSVTIIGGKAPYTGGWVLQAGDAMTITGSLAAFYFETTLAEPIESQFANYVYTVTDSSSPPVVKSSQYVNVLLQGS